MAESSPRFRIRFEDGSELPANSVEGLARRIARGDIVPDTELFDAGTGEWGAASDSSVVRFILDELVRDGQAVPIEWQASGALEQPRPDTLPQQGDTPQDTPRPVDPLDLKLTVPQEVDGGLDGASEASEAVREGYESAPADAPRGDGWVTPRSEGGLLAEGGGAPPSADAEAALRSTDSEVRPASASARSGVGAPVVGPARARVTRRPWAAAAAVGAVAVMSVAIAWGIGRPGRGDTPPPTQVDAPAAVEAPEGLDAVAEDAVARLSGRMLAVADSVRVTHDLSRTPPEGWLTGPYMAGAGAYPEIRLYWERYGAFLEDLRTIDDEQISAYLEDAGEAAPSGRRDDLDAYLEARHQLAIPRRAELFDQLESATEQALALHDFLVTETAQIRYTPALGTNEVPRDPVLEVASDSAPIREALSDRLDMLFEALDRSRGGGPPEMSGLGTDLFRGFGLF